MFEANLKMIRCVQHLMKMGESAASGMIQSKETVVTFDSYKAFYLHLFLSVKSLAFLLLIIFKT